MKNFITKIEYIIEPETIYGEDCKFIVFKVRCRTATQEIVVQKVEHIDFMKSNFDLIFDCMKEELKAKFLEVVDN